jgi:hypothetical protein
MRAASAEVVARTLPRSALAVTVGSEELERRAVGPGPTAAITSGGDGTAATLVPVGGAVARAEESRLLAPEEAPADELDDYNRYLAALAVKGRPKTWRNPRGL